MIKCGGLCITNLLLCKGTRLGRMRGITVNVIQFSDENIRVNEKGKPWGGAKYQREVLTLAYRRHFSIRLWSEVRSRARRFSPRLSQSGKPSQMPIARSFAAPTMRSRRFPVCFRQSASLSSTTVS